jgi:urea transport system substrate-binding protein
MKSASLLRGIVLGLLVLQRVLVVPVARAGEDTIKIGILHSLSGTMAISESVLKDTVLMLMADQAEAVCVERDFRVWYETDQRRWLT